MAENKTQETNNSVEYFIETVDNEQKRADCKQLIDIMQDISGYPAKMWGDSIVGFGKFHYKSKSGREGDWHLCGFSPRKDNISIYLGFDVSIHNDLLSDFGKHKTGKGCLYIKKLADINIDILKQMIESSIAVLRKQYPDS